VNFQSRIKSKGIFSDELAILEKVNKEKAVFFKDLAKEYQKNHISYIIRSLAIKGLVDLCVISRKAGRCRLYFLIDRGKVREIKPSEKEKFAIGMKTLLKIGIPVIVKERGSL